MEKLYATFNKAKEEHESFRGMASITIGDAVRLNSISVYEKDGKMSIDFPDFTKKDGSKGEYVIPKSKEAYAAMLGVVEKAMKSDEGYAYTNGSTDPKIAVEGHKVDEPYADGRYNIEVGEMVVLRDITSAERNGKNGTFVAVDFPTVEGLDGKPSTYIDTNGEKQFNHVFDALEMQKENEPKDFNRLIENMVKAKRKEFKPSLDEQLKGADEKAKNQKTAETAKEKEAEAVR